MLCVLLAKKYCKVQSALYYYFENTEGIIRSEISNAKIRDAKIIMDHIRQAIQSRKAELGNVIEQCYCEIQTFLLWHQYIEPYSRIETFMNRELDICKEEFLKSEPDIFNNPYVKAFSDNVILKRMSKLRVTAKKMDNAYFLDNAMHICLGIHDKDGNYSVWAGTTMQSIVENTKAPIVFHILHDDTLNEINKNKSRHIITIEDPVEFIHTPKHCIINQREIGLDCQSYANALRAAMREDPDIILLGELRDRETMSTAMTAVETGHLVFSTVHTEGAAKTIDRLIDIFPADQQQQIRVQLSTSLKAVISQRLLPRATGGRVAAFEMMFVTKAISNLIRENKTANIDQSIQLGSQTGMITMKKSIEGLLKQGIITAQTAKAWSFDIGETDQLIT